MLPQEIIRKKRDGKTLTKEEIQFFIDGVISGEIDDCQISAFTMAVFFRGMNADETGVLTGSMMNSGKILSWDNSENVVDKHSTGGVGDKLSLMIAPIAACAGVRVPMISGRGLGHTGGTLDKLESIPGYNTSPSIEEFQRIVNKIGCSIIGQTSDMAPADKKIYSIRDITATVESVPLITSSILSKKFCSGISGLVMDIKCGNGAFMNSIEEAQELSSFLEDVCNSRGVRIRSRITDMNSVLGNSVGNALEIIEAVDFLKNKLPEENNQYRITMELCADMLITGNITNSFTEALAICEENLKSGKALKKFGAMISSMGGPEDFIDSIEEYLPKAKYKKDVISSKSGIIQGHKTREFGLEIIRLKGGRTNPKDSIDHSSGFTNIKSPGENVKAGESLLSIHGNDSSVLNDMSSIIEDLFLIE